MLRAKVLIPNFLCTVCSNGFSLSILANDLGESGEQFSIHFGPQWSFAFGTRWGGELTFPILTKNLDSSYDGRKVVSGFGYLY